MDRCTAVAAAMRLRNVKTVGEAREKLIEALTTTLRLWKRRHVQ